MALTRQALDNFYSDVKPYLEDVIGQDFMESPTLYSQILNMKSTQYGWKDTATASGFGTFTSKPELQEADNDDILQGPTARTTIVTYAKRNTISQEAIEDATAANVIAQRMPLMLRAGRASQEILGHSVLNGGFAATTTPDGVALFSDSHVRLDGGAGDNLTTGDLTNATYEAAKVLMAQMVDDRGLPVYVKAQKLVVDPVFETQARVILESPGGGALIGGTWGAANDAINPYHNDVQIVSSQYLTDADGDAWFLLADNHMLNFVWRVKPENWSEVDYSTSGVEVGVRYRCAVEALDWRGVVGSAGS